MLANLFTRVARWLLDPDKPLYEHEALTMGDPYFAQQERLEQIRRIRPGVKYALAVAVKKHAKRSHLQAQLKALTEEQLQIERELKAAGVIPQADFWRGA